MKIVVMCGTYQQFREYVGSMLRDRNKIPAKVSFNGCSSVANIDSVQFIYCNSSYMLKGRSFDRDDHIIKIGSWYNIPTETQEAIVTEFMARTEK